jgi:hypothetical protein
VSDNGRLTEACSTLDTSALAKDLSALQSEYWSLLQQSKVPSLKKQIRHLQALSSAGKRLRAAITAITDPKNPGSDLIESVALWHTEEVKQQIRSLAGLPPRADFEPLPPNSEVIGAYMRLLFSDVNVGSLHWYTNQPRLKLDEIRAMTNALIAWADQAASEANLREKRTLRRYGSLQDSSQPSPTRWLIARAIPEVYERHFGRKGFSRDADGTPSGPMVRFASVILEELKVVSDKTGRPLSAEGLIEYWRCPAAALGNDGKQSSAPPTSLPPLPIIPQSTPGSLMIRAFVFHAT